MISSYCTEKFWNSDRKVGLPYPAHTCIGPTLISQTGWTSRVLEALLARAIESTTTQCHDTKSVPYTARPPPQCFHNHINTGLAARLHEDSPPPCRKTTPPRSPPTTALFASSSPSQCLSLRARTHKSLAADTKHNKRSHLPLHSADLLPFRAPNRATRHNPPLPLHPPPHLERQRRIRDLRL